MDIRSLLAAQSYAKAKPATEPDPTGSTGAMFGQIAGDFTDTLTRAETTAEATMAGKADPHSLVEALAQTQLAVETAVTLRDKVVEAYQEILRMPV